MVPKGTNWSNRKVGCCCCCCCCIKKPLMVQGTKSPAQGPASPWGFDVHLCDAEPKKHGWIICVVHYGSMGMVYLAKRPQSRVPSCRGNHQGMSYHFKTKWHDFMIVPTHVIYESLSMAILNPKTLNPNLGTANTMESMGKKCTYSWHKKGRYAGLGSLTFIYLSMNSWLFMVS